MTPKEKENLRMKLGWLYLTAHCNQKNIPSEYTDWFIECDGGSNLLSLFSRLAKESDYVRLSNIAHRAEAVLDNLSRQGVDIMYCVMPRDTISNDTNIRTIGDGMAEDYDTSGFMMALLHK